MQRSPQLQRRCDCWESTQAWGCSCRPWLQRIQLTCCCCRTMLMPLRCEEGRKLTPAAACAGAGLCHVPHSAGCLTLHPSLCFVSPACNRLPPHWQLLGPTSPLPRYGPAAWLRQRVHCSTGRCGCQEQSQASAWSIMPRNSAPCSF
jgi:hypothetical protein